MSQGLMIHTYSSLEYAQAVAWGLQAEGYAFPWDGEAGGMKGINVAPPESAPCVILLLTRDALVQKWVLEYGAVAHARGTLIQVLVDPVDSPFPSPVPPIDFTDWDGRPAGPQWKALMDRVRAKSGRPIGRLPFKEQFQPVMAVWAVGLVTVAMLVTGGKWLQPSGEELADRGPIPEAAPAPETAMGGPATAPAALAREPVSATFEEDSYIAKPKVNLRYVPMAAPTRLEERDGMMMTVLDLGAG